MSLAGKYAIFWCHLGCKADRPTQMVMGALGSGDRGSENVIL